VIFFAGHSETEGETGRIYLNPTDSLTIDELWLHLKQAVNRGLKLAIFNSCDGLGLVRRLDDLEIPHLIVMRELVPDRVAQEFLKYLLTALSQDKPVHLAVREARERLEILEHEFPCATWLPVIHQNIEYIPVSSPAPPPASIPLKQICLISLAVTTLVMGIRWTGFLQSAELQAYDHLMRSRPAEEPDPRLLLVSIDEEDIRQYTYPIPADTLATALEKLQRKKPIAIGVNIYQDSPVGTGKDRLLNLLKNNQQFISACKFESDDNQNLEVTNPPPGIADGQVGFVNIMRDWQQGYSIRRQILSRSDNPVSSFSQCNTPYSLTLLLAIEYLEFNQLIAQSNIHQDWELGEIVFRRLNSYSGGYQNLDARGNQILVNYRNTKQIAQSVSLRDILNEKYHPDWIENKIVLVGVTASSVDFGENTPIGMLPKLYVQAQMLSSIISTVEKERLLIRWLPVWADALWVGSWSLLGVGLVIYRRSRHPWFWATVGTVTAILYGCCWVAFTVGIWLPLIPAAIGLLVPIAIYSVTRPTKSSISQIPP
jgi:CHASE2 domain-containing sensor protein